MHITAEVARWMGGEQGQKIILAIKAEITFQGRGTEGIEISMGHGVAPG